MATETISTQYLHSGAYPIDAKVQVEDEEYIRALIMNNQHWKGMKIINMDTLQEYTCVSKFYPVPDDIDAADWSLLFERDWIINDIGVIGGGEY